MKKALIVLGLIVLGVAPHVFAEGFVPLAPIPGLTDKATVGSVIGPDTLANFFNNLYKYLIGVAATLAVIEIIWGGLLYSTTDSVGNKEQGKEKIQMAIFGLILVLSPVLVFSIINPSILNLSLNLPPIKTLTTPAGSLSGTGSTTEAVANGCTVSLNQGTVGCSTREAAEAFAASCSNGQGQVYLSSDAAARGVGNTSEPYVASCNRLGTQQPGASQNYTDKTQIPAGLWCYTTNVPVKTSAFESILVKTFVCGASKDACDQLTINNTAGGTVVNGCQQY